MSKNHFTCHLCGDKFKHLYYKDYSSLEKHFDLTHYLCRDEICRASNYIVFWTADELTVHQAKIHKQGSDYNQAKHLLGFNSLGHSPKKDEITFKDKEGIDYSWWFGPEYCV